MIQVTELGYMGVGVKDLDAWKNFATSIVGFELAEEGESDRCYLRMDYFHHRIVLHADGSDDLAYLGLRVAGADEFAQMQRQLSEAGIKFRVGSDDEADERRVLEVLKLEDPGGNPVEIFHGPLMQFTKPFHPGRAMHGRFKTGTGGLGHCIVRERRRRCGPALLYSPRDARRRRVQISRRQDAPLARLHALQRPRSHSRLRNPGRAIAGSTTSCSRWTTSTTSA